MMTTFFILRSARREIALASALGKPLLGSVFHLFLENMLLTLVGSVLALAVSGAILGTAALAVGAVFLGVALLESFGAVVLVCRFDLLNTLLKQEESA